MSGIVVTKVLKVRKFKAGYEIRTELWDHGEGPLEMRAAYTPTGDYIGSPKHARYLVVKRGIVPERRTATSNVCSIGYCKRKKKWFGWSHRAIFGFGVGYTVRNGDSFDRRMPVGFKAKTLADAKRLASAFAESVS